MKAEQFKVKNQFIIRGGNKIIFQSYDSTIAAVDNGSITLGTDWDYSRTTLKYLYAFLDEQARYIVNAELKSVINSIFLYTNLLGGIFMLIGIVSTSKEIRKRKKGRGFLFKLFFTASLICVLLFCAVSKTNFGTLYRFGVLSYFLTFFEGVGLIAFCRKAKKIKLKRLVCVFLCASMLLFTAEFAFIYTNGLKSKMSIYGDSLFESIEFVEEKSKKDNFTVFLGTSNMTDDIALAERYLVYLEYYFDSNEKVLPYKEQIFELTAINDDIRNGKVKTVSNTTDGSIKCSFAENVNQLTDDYNIVYSDYLDMLDYSQEYTVEDFGAWSVVYKNL